MRTTTILLSLLVLGCVHAAPVATPTAPPNRVCVMVSFDHPKSTCTASGGNLLRGDIARVDADGGSKFCWETFDKNGYDCATFVLSKTEAAQVAVDQERKRVKAEAEAKAKLDEAKKPVEAKPEPTKAPVPPVKAAIPVKAAPKP